jgi:hypothetical protein
MTVGTVSPNVFDAGLPTLDYDVTATPAGLPPTSGSATTSADRAGTGWTEVLSYELVRTTLRDNRFQIPPGYILAVQGITSGPLWDKVVNSLLGMEGAQHQRVRSVVSKAFTPPSGRASTRHDRGCDRRNSLNQPSGSVRRRHRDRAALPRAHHLRPARRASQRLATVFILDRTDMVARRHRCRLRHGGAL